MFFLCTLFDTIDMTISVPEWTINEIMNLLPICMHKQPISKKQLQSITVEPLLWGHPFCIRKVAFQEGWPLVRGRNQYIYV